MRRPELTPARSRSRRAHHADATRRRLIGGSRLSGPPTPTCRTLTGSCLATLSRSVTAGLVRSQSAIAGKLCDARSARGRFHSTAESVKPPALAKERMLAPSPLAPDRITTAPPRPRLAALPNRTPLPLAGRGVHLFGRAAASPHVHPRPSHHGGIRWPFEVWSDPHGTAEPAARTVRLLSPMPGHPPAVRVFAATIAVAGGDAGDVPDVRYRTPRPRARPLSAR